MLKPVAFKQHFVAVRNIPYLFGAPGERGDLQGGVLGQGKTVWGSSSEVPDQSTKLAAFFVEDLGVISLDPHWLVPAKIVQRPGQA